MAARSEMARVFRILYSSKSRSLSSFSSGAEQLDSRQGGFEILGTKEYDDYRKSRYGNITHKALLVDAFGTLVAPSQPMAQIYRKIGEKYGVAYSEDEILNRYRWAYEQLWGRSRLRCVDDGRHFLEYIVKSSTGCSDSQYFEELYQYYQTDKVCSISILEGILERRNFYNLFQTVNIVITKLQAWHLCDPDAERVFKALRKAGVKLAAVSKLRYRTTTSLTGSKV